MSQPPKDKSQIALDRIIAAKFAELVQSPESKRLRIEAAAALREVVADPSNPVPFGHCANCTMQPQPGQDKFNKCGRCKAVTYCGKTCQAAHWPLHKKDCKTPPVESKSQVDGQRPAETAERVNPDNGPKGDEPSLDRIDPVPGTFTSDGELALFNELQDIVDRFKSKEAKLREELKAADPEAEKKIRLLPVTFSPLREVGWRKTPAGMFDERFRIISTIERCINELERALKITKKK